MVYRLAGEESFSVGISLGATAIAVIRVIAELEEYLIIAVFQDAGYKYWCDITCGVQHGG